MDQSTAHDAFVQSEKNAGSDGRVRRQGQPVTPEQQRLRSRYVNFASHGIQTHHLGGLYLLIIRCPDAARDLALQVDLRGPVSLAADRAHQHEAVPVGDEGLCAIVGPGKVTNLRGDGGQR